jgi:hypothetical protein
MESDTKVSHTRSRGCMTMTTTFLQSTWMGKRNRKFKQLIKHQYGTKTCGVVSFKLSPLKPGEEFPVPTM